MSNTPINVMNPAALETLSRFAKADTSPPCHHNFFFPAYFFDSDCGEIHFDYSFHSSREELY
jgi:hypothetical protein